MGDISQYKKLRILGRGKLSQHNMVVNKIASLSLLHFLLLLFSFPLLGIWQHGPFVQHRIFPSRISAEINSPHLTSPLLSVVKHAFFFLFYTNTTFLFHSHTTCQTRVQTRLLCTIRSLDARHNCTPTRLARAQGHTVRHCWLKRMGSSTCSRRWSSAVEVEPTKKTQPKKSKSFGWLNTLTLSCTVLESRVYLFKLFLHKKQHFKYSASTSIAPNDAPPLSTHLYLNHARYYDSAVVSGSLWIVMELAKDGDLYELVDAVKKKKRKKKSVCYCACVRACVRVALSLALLATMLQERCDVSATMLIW